MYQNIKQTKIKQQTYQKISINSVRLIDFNHQWTHPFQEQFQKGKTRKNDFQINKSEQRHDKYFLKQQDYAKTRKNQHANTQYIKETNNLQSDSLNLISKMKAFSKMQNQQILNAQKFQKSSKDQESITSVKEQYEDLTINSTKLKTLKLPEIKKSSRENCIIKRVNFQKLKQIHNTQRIINVKSSSQDQENPNLNSQQGLKNKVEQIRKLNSKLRKTRNATQMQSGNSAFASNRNTSERKFAMMRQQQAKSISTVPLKAKISILSPENIDQQFQKQKELSTQKQVKNADEQEEKQQKIQIYDKKMKIGRKKKKEEDRIRAMLLKTLQKTKGTDYVAQQGSSQTKKSPRSPRVTNIQKSRSNERQKQKTNLILVDPNTNQSSLKRSSLKKYEVQKPKSSLLPINSSRFSQQQQPSNYVKNKKFVQMVREIQNKKKFFQQQLQEIKEQKTSNQDEHNQHSNQRFTNQ